MTERGFHPFAVLHFLRKTILLYLLPLLQVLFARNWAALRTALVQGRGAADSACRCERRRAARRPLAGGCTGNPAGALAAGRAAGPLPESQPAGSAHHRAAPALPAGRCQPGGAVPCRAEAHPDPAFERAERAVFS